jgi:hypothetical protein
MTFAKACTHLTNFTSGHESRGDVVGPERLDYPTGHIEVDNRLSWLLGLLGDRYPDAFYVHLRRDPEAVARSFERRLHMTMKTGIIDAFGYGIIQRATSYAPGERREVCRFYVDTVTANISEFLRYRNHATVWLETADHDFPRFLDLIGAQGDHHAAMAEWTTRHNASPE